MADKGYILSEADGKAIQELLNTQKRQRLNTSGRGRDQHVENEEQMAPEVYVARTPAGGILPLINPGVDAIPGTSSAEFYEETGTGQPNQVGFATCNIYRVHVGTDRDVQLHRVGNKKLVYNLTEMPIVGNMWILTMRDKFGAWIAIPPQVEVYKQVDITDPDPNNTYNLYVGDADVIGVILPVFGLRKKIYITPEVVFGTSGAVWNGRKVKIILLSAGWLELIGGTTGVTGLGMAFSVIDYTPPSALLLQSAMHIVQFGQPTIITYLNGKWYLDDTRYFSLEKVTPVTASPFDPILNSASGDPTYIPNYMEGGVGPALYSFGESYQYQRTVYMAIRPDPTYPTMPLYYAGCDFNPVPDPGTAGLVGRDGIIIVGGIVVRFTLDQIYSALDFLYGKYVDHEARIDILEATGVTGFEARIAALEAAVSDPGGLLDRVDAIELTLSGAFTDGTYIVGAPLTGGGTDGEITIVSGIVTNVQEAT